MKTISFQGTFTGFGAIVCFLFCWTVTGAQSNTGELLYSAHEINDIRLSSASVSWVTNRETDKNWVEVKKVGTDSVMYFEDEYNQPSFTHGVDITGLSPQTDYLYRFGSGETGWDNGGSWYPFHTGKFLGIPQPNNLAGYAVTSQGEPIYRSIVRIRFQHPGWPASEKRTVLTNEAGEWWTVPGDFLDSDGNYYYPAEGDKIIVEYYVNYWSSAIDSSHVYNGSSIDEIPEVAIKVLDPTKGTKGDIDNDGAVNIFDLLGILQLMSGATTPDVIQEFAADLDEDGSISVFDLLKMLEMLSSGQ